MKQAIDRSSQSWLKILGKGMVTIPKNWRESLGIDVGEVVRAQKIGNKIIIEAGQPEVPYRVYTDSEILGFLKEDKIPKSLLAKITNKLKSSK